MYQTLQFTEEDGGIAVVTLNRPARANAMNQEMLAELGTLCGEIAASQSIRCVIVTGAGAAFCSGFDLKDQAANTPSGVEQWTDVLERDFNGIMSFWSLPQPSIAAVNGPALAGGFELMLGCDMSICTGTAIFGEPELQFGAGIVAMLLPWFVGPKVAKTLILTANDQITAAEALQYGFVTRIVAADELMVQARRMARRVASFDPRVVNLTKNALNRTYDTMGMKSALRSALDIDVMIEGAGSPLKRDFLQVVRERGMSAALAWRDERSG